MIQREDADPFRVGSQGKKNRWRVGQSSVPNYILCGFFWIFFSLISRAKQIPAQMPCLFTLVMRIVWLASHRLPRVTSITSTVNLDGAHVHRPGRKRPLWFVYLLFPPLIFFFWRYFCRRFQSFTSPFEQIICLFVLSLARRLITELY